MKSLILIIISGALINNVVLNQFLGICSFLGVSKQMKASTYDLQIMSLLL